MMVNIKAHAEFGIVNEDGMTIYYTTKKGDVYVVADPDGGYSGNVVIPEKIKYNNSNYYVVGIDRNAFYGCSDLISITIPKSINKIEGDAFKNCTSLQKVIINDLTAWCGISFSGQNSNPLYYAQHLYNEDNTEITDLIIPERVKSISDYAFYGCSGLTSITFSENFTTIGKYVFYNCSGLKSITINESLTTIGDYAFYGCNGITATYHRNEVKKLYFSNAIEKVILGDEVTRIGYDAFKDWTNLASVTISKNVTYIGNDAFRGCTGLKKVIINDIVAWCGISSNYSINPLSYAHHLYSDEETEITDLIIPDGVTTIAGDAFLGCSNLTSVTIPSSVSSIGKGAFSGCSGLKKVIINDIAAWCGINFEFKLSTTYPGIYPDDYSSNPLSYAKHLYSDENTEITDLVIPEGVASINNYAFYNCQGLTSVSYPSSLGLIGDYAFFDCKGLTDVTIPANITGIGKYAFYGLNGSITLLNDNLTTGLTSTSFGESSKIFVHRGTKTLLYLWGLISTNNIYEIGKTQTILTRPDIELISKTQTTLKMRVYGFYNEYTYKLGSDLLNDRINNGIALFTGLRPDYSISSTLYVSLDGYSYRRYLTTTIKTSPISPSVKEVDLSPSTLTAETSYIKGDAVVASELVKLNGKELDKSLIDGNIIHLTGLDPSSSQKIEYIITVKYGENLDQTFSYTGSRTITTKALQMATQQPKVTSLGNAIVAADTNLEDEEQNVGFEWRRTDWGSDFASNTGKAPLYEGRLEGYIRNLNTNYLWKYRPYFLSNSGKYYYGDWVGLDPSNTSYFEPTVHTYANITIEGNTALVKGYALEGTDNVTVQGFKYWKSTASAPSLVPALSVPANATTVVANGQVMTTTLTNLDYGTTYCYVAFVTTSEGETFYGEEQTFTTENAPTDIQEIETNVEDKEIRIIGYYDLNGRQLSTPVKGVNIIRYSDGTTRKMINN